MLETFFAVSMLGKGLNDWLLGGSFVGPKKRTTLVLVRQLYLGRGSGEPSSQRA